VLPVADALLIGRYVDGVIMSVMRDVTRIPMMMAAHERLGVLNIRVLGTVVSGMAGDGYGPHYSYHYAAAPAAQA
jgi:Mrp family chromosome partitioning ATPase